MIAATSLSPTLRALLERGVVMPQPEAVTVDDAVMPERIAEGVVLHAGTRLRGDTLSIGPHSQIGEEGPVTLDNCQLGHAVAFKGGYARGAVMLDGAVMGAGAHIRSGTVMEEQSSGAHTVGFKQTILFPYVTTGSLINFCDCFMAGGTSRKNHSEVGSSYIHFNFTPHGDKATPSLIGDVPRGVWLDQPPIFLGGQGGLVGPARVEYGVVIAAGVIQRGDALSAGCLYTGAGAHAGGPPRPYPLGRYGAIGRLVRNNLLYIGNMVALQWWYREVRNRFMHRDPYCEACRLGGIQALNQVIKERIKRLDDLSEKLTGSADAWRKISDGARTDAMVQEHVAFQTKWPILRERIKQPVPGVVGASARDRFLNVWRGTEAPSHLEAIHALPGDVKQAGTEWLQAIVEYIAAEAKTDHN